MAEYRQSILQIKAAWRHLAQSGIASAEYEFVTDTYRVKLLLPWEPFCYPTDFVLGSINITEPSDIFKPEKDTMESLQTDHSGLSVEVRLKEARGRKSFGETNTLRQVST